MHPGQSYDIEIAIPADHTRGTYWYHPHHHGGADIQIASGMAGALIVEGDFADVPEIAAATERLLLINQVVFDDCRMVEGFETVFPEGATRFFTINGQREPIIRMRPGEVQRWRILHAGYQDDILLALEGHELHQIARDGIALSTHGSASGPPGADPAADPAAILLAPAQRVDVLVQAGEPGTYALQALPYFQGYDAPTGPLATVDRRRRAAADGSAGGAPPRPLAPIGDEELTGVAAIDLLARMRRRSTPPGIGGSSPSWSTVSCSIHERVDQQVALGAVEEWTVTNLDEHNDHVFHIHINPFQLTQVNGEPVAEPVWLDTVVVPHGGSVTFRSRFLDFTGKYVLHCHMMNHEELGMMQVVEVSGA